VRGVFSAGEGTFLDELLAIAGARNWARRLGTGYFEVPLDLLAADPPDLVLEYAAGIAGTPAERAQVWAELPGRDAEVREVRTQALMIPGPRLADSAVALANALRPGAEP
jgi:hypothetical protein